MGSIRFNGVRFTVYPQDHAPRHVHGFYGELEVIVELRADGKAALANRRDAVQPGNGSLSDLRHILTIAGRHFDHLVALWEENHD